MFPEANWSEHEFRRQILLLCDQLDLIVNYHRSDRSSPVPGWPDLEIVGHGGIVHRELKTMGGVLSVDQRRIGSIINAAGMDWGVWRPADWHNKIIQGRLIKLGGKL